MPLCGIYHMDTFHYDQSSLFYNCKCLALFPGLPTSSSETSRNCIVFSLAVPISRHSHSSRHIPKPGASRQAPIGPSVSEPSSRIPTFSPVHAVSTATKSSARHTSPLDTVPTMSAHTTEHQPAISPSHIPVVTKRSSVSSPVHLTSKVQSQTAEYHVTDVSSPSSDPPSSGPQAKVTKFGGTESRSPESNSLTSQSKMKPKGDHSETPEILKLDKECMEKAAAPSGSSLIREGHMSVQGFHTEYPSLTVSSPEKQTDHAVGLGPISSTESLEVTGSETSLASRRSLPVTLGSKKSAFAHPAVHSLSQQQFISLSVSLPHLDERTAATKGRRWAYIFI